MKCQISKHCSGYEVYGYAGKSIGHIGKQRVGRKNLWCLISDDLAWWRPDCLREVADFIDTLEVCGVAKTSAQHAK
jgi:hypothetical protein